jgi:ABC-type uncharacterized transport system involved in gliding motility auxiliary subunit
MKKYAPLGLYITLAAILCTIGLYVVYQRFSLPVQIGLGVIVIGLAVFALLDPQKVREIFSGRQMRYGSNVAVMTIAVLGILVVVNYLGANNSIRFDFTQDKTYTLSPETLQLLKELPEPVFARAFFSPRNSSDSAKKLLDNYRLNSNKKFDYQFINPDENPIAAEDAKVTRDGTISLQMGDHREQVTYVSEEEITTALIRLVRPQNRIIYFLMGHGEFDPSGTDDTSYAYTRVALEGKNYTVKQFNLVTSGNIPDDASALVIAGPQKQLSEDEINAIKSYQAKGGSLVVLSEPPIDNISGTAGNLLSDYLLGTWKITLQNDIVIEPNSKALLIAISDHYQKNHPITQKMMDVLTTFPTARSIIVDQNPPQNLLLTPLIASSDKSWGETNFEALKKNQVNLEEGKDIPGPMFLAVAGEDSQSKARVVVIGDADFASNRFYTDMANGDFIINSIDWAAKQDNLINITPRKNTTRYLLPPKQITMGLILFGTVFALPGAILACGIIVYIQRKRRA